MRKGRVMHWSLIVLAAVAGVVVLVVLVGYMLPKGHVAWRTARFASAPQVIWDIVTDHAGHPGWRSKLKSVERLPDAHGHAVWLEVASDGSKMPLEMVESDPPRRLVGRIADPGLPYGGTWTYELVPDGAGTRLSITERGEVYNPVFRVVSRFMDKHATIDRFLGDLADKLGEKYSPEG